MDTTDCAPVPK